MKIESVLLEMMVICPCTSMYITCFFKFLIINTVMFGQVVVRCKPKLISFLMKLNDLICRCPTKAFKGTAEQNDPRSKSISLIVEWFLFRIRYLWIVRRKSRVLQRLPVLNISHMKPFCMMSKFNDCIIGPLFTKRTDALPQDLAKFRHRDTRA